MDNLIGSLYIAYKKHDIIDAMDKKRYKASFLFFTDSHWPENDKYLPVLLRKIAALSFWGGGKNFFGGDFLTNSYKKKTYIMQVAQRFRTAFDIPNMAFYPVLGNHDDNSYKQEYENAILSDEEIGKLIYMKVGQFDSVTRDNENFYYYVDSHDEGMRYIVLNTAKSENITENQINFFCKSLLDTPDDWNIVIMAHIWYEWDEIEHVHKQSQFTIELTKIVDAYNTRLSYERYDYKQGKGRVLVILGGHIHRDLIARTETGVPIIICDTDCQLKSCSHTRHFKYAPQRNCVTLVSITYKEMSKC